MQWTFQDDSGVPLDLSAVSIASQIRTATGDLVSAVPITFTDQLGVVIAEVSDTALWPAGLLRCDIRASIAGSVAMSDTIGIRVNRGITQ